MAREAESIDVTQSPELLRLVEEVERSGEAKRLCRGGRTVAIVSPVSPPARKRAPSRRRTGLLSPDDPFWKLVGIGRSGLGDVSSNKQKYLGEAYYPDDSPPHE
jgi:antitoxin (DNA-binding transcriptional repressor) of toxin-antitoxin stability system